MQDVRTAGVKDFPQAAWNPKLRKVDHTNKVQHTKNAHLPTGKKASLDIKSK